LKHQDEQYIICLSFYALLAAKQFKENFEDNHLVFIPFVVWVFGVLPITAPSTKWFLMSKQYQLT
jgi:hypothetical protein